MFLASSNSSNGIMFTVVWLVVMFGFMYFFMIKPQKKQQKAHEELMSAIEVGDSVRTTSGFYGTVIDITDDIVIVEFGNKNCRIPMDKNAIADVEKANQ